MSQQIYVDSYRDQSGVYLPIEPVMETDEGYDSVRIQTAARNQAMHFWQLGRFRFLLQALKDEICGQAASSLSLIDIGGGTGGWVKYLEHNYPARFREVAIGDSSLSALQFSRGLNSQVDHYQIDVLKLPWKSRWDLVFLLDVIEHLQQDVEVLKSIKNILRPGGLLFVTAPALNCFWSREDDAAHHFRRYAKNDFLILAKRSGLELVRARYFMFFLSPLLWLRRFAWPDLGNMSNQEIQMQKQKTHRVPITPINHLLRLIFSLETPVGLRIPFPWGTSLLGVFKANSQPFRN
ncbi:MAG: methyltransferase domain-containing protein [Deltaproteobacteria bacterium]|nr:methyltransferase domain-containing protein [Deltaproteobacteria bacterium]